MQRNDLNSSCIYYITLLHVTISFRFYVLLLAPSDKLNVNETFEQFIGLFKRYPHLTYNQNLRKTWCKKTTLSCYIFLFSVQEICWIFSTPSSYTTWLWHIHSCSNHQMLKDVKDKRNDEAKPNELPYRNNQILTRG